MKTLTSLLLILIGQIALAGTASYEVPTSQINLKAASIFKIEDLKLKLNDDGSTTLKYVVPEELTGLKNELEFTGNLVDGTGDLTSDSGYMKCLSNHKKMMCTVSYQKLDFDNGLALQKLSLKFQDLELKNRLSVQERFAQDPIGIIHIRLRR